MAAVSPSDEVVEALQAVHKAMVDFQIEVLTLRGLRGTARTNASAAIDEAERVMRDELAKL